MELSIFIAKIIAVIYLAFGVGLIVNSNYYRKVILKLLNDATYIILGGIIAIIIGFFIVENHNYWVKNWTVIITIIGWVALIKGVLLLAFPSTITFFKPLFNNGNVTKILTPLVLIFGLIFAYFGFVN
ncbi:hypothetical protein SAMN05444411_101143 [Lutibacter oricola]|uniref:Uncharacterized protein n=1 Tax=Lutibacter oricola TaxID=762486 RepID=A0A1H2R3U6_9FLAO|nr:hypothetical protein [Lutibacter oricola]SDW14015.1 hypothetical protein SAMN05444411_101143 [Lutibacter oricola]